MHTSKLAVISATTLAWPPHAKSDACCSERSGSQCSYDSAHLCVNLLPLLLPSFICPLFVFSDAGFCIYFEILLFPGRPPGPALAQAQIVMHTAAPYLFCVSAAELVSGVATPSLTKRLFTLAVLTAPSMRDFVGYRHLLPVNGIHPLPLAEPGLKYKSPTNSRITYRHILSRQLENRVIK